MKTKNRTWEEWWAQWTPEQRKKLEESWLLKEAIIAEDMEKASLIASDILKPPIRTRKGEKLFMKRHRRNKAFMKQCRELGIDLTGI